MYSSKERRIASSEPVKPCVVGRGGVGGIPGVEDCLCEMVDPAAVGGGEVQS